MRVITAEQIYVDHAFAQGYGILVEGDTIREVGPFATLLPDSAAGQGSSLASEDWGRTAILPGTVNAHTHSFQSLLRGVADDRPFFAWRDQALYRFLPRLGPKGVYAGALLAFGEMLMYGVTTACDFFYVHDGSNDNAEAVMRAARDLGMRLVLARAMYDWSGAPASFVESVADATRRCARLMEKYRDDPWVQVCPAPHSPHAASAEMIQAGWRLAEEADGFFHIHVAEGRYEVEQIQRDHGLTPVRWLDRLGVLGPRMVAVHCVWLDDGEILALGQAGAALAYCAASNMYLGDGVTRLPEMLEAGVRVGLGTDGACSNNRTSVFDEMRTCSLLQKVARLDGAAITAETVFHVGTAGGGAVLGLPVGRIAPGYKADLVGVDLAHLSLQPRHSLLKSIVYALSPAAINRVMVGGRLVCSNGDLLTVPLDRIRRQVADVTAGWDVA